MVSETKKAMKMTLSINERTIDQLNEWRTKHVTNRQMTLILAFFIGLFASLAALVLHSIIELIQEILFQDCMPTPQTGFSSYSPS